MPFRDPKPALEYILENIAKIERFVSGLSEEEFYADDKAQYSVQLALQRIGEAGRRLGDQAEMLCPDIPWMEIRSIGNLIRHDYDNVNMRIIWNTVQHDLRPLQLAAMIALNGLEASEDPG